MSADRPFLIVGLLINSALYLAAVVAAGLWTGHLAAVYLAIAAMGICYLSYAVQVMLPAKVWLAQGLITASIPFGAIAGLMLLVPR